MHPLTVPDVRRGRLFLRPLKVLFLLAWGLLVAMEVIHEPLEFVDAASRAPIWSLRYLTTGLQVAAITLPITVLWVPRVALALSVPVLWLVSFGETSFPSAWQLLSALSAVALVWLLLPRRGLSVGRLKKVSIGHPFAESHASTEKRLQRVWLLVGLGGSLVLLVLHQVLAANTIAFEARARTTTAEVVAHDADETELTLRLEGREVTVAEPDSDAPAVGSRVSVLVDPDDPAHVVFLGSLEDPSWLLGAAVTAPAAGAAAGLPSLLRNRNRRRLLEAPGAPLFTARYLMGTGRGDPDGGRLVPVDGTRPVLVLRNLELAVPATAAEAAVDRVDDLEDEDDETDEVPPRSGAALAQWADEWWLAEGMPSFDGPPAGDERLVAELTGPFTRPLESVQVVGDWREGSSVALLHGDGVWFGEVEPSLVRSGTPDLEPTSWAERNIRWLRWLVACLLAAGFGWLMPIAFFDPVPVGFEWVLLALPMVPLLYLPFVTLAWTVDSLVPNGRGLVEYGTLWDEHTMGDRVVAVAAGDHAVGIALREPDDALAIPPNLIAAGLTPEEAAAELRKRFVRPPHRWSRTPSPALLSCATAVLLVVAQALAHL